VEVADPVFCLVDVGNWRGLQENTARSGQPWTRGWRDEVYTAVLHTSTESTTENLRTGATKTTERSDRPESGRLHKHRRNVAHYWWSGVCHRPGICKAEGWCELYAVLMKQQMGLRSVITDHSTKMVA